MFLELDVFFGSFTLHNKTDAIFHLLLQQNYCLFYSAFLDGIQLKTHKLFMYKPEEEDWLAKRHLRKAV